MEDANKMKLYEAVRSVPKEALKDITAGRLKGMSDINPMWRIKVLTEQFGICGIGWYFTVDKQDVITCGNEAVAVVNISLYIRDESGEWSKPIFGTGGSKLITQERNGPYVSDEAFKMATTDAISVACKHLGVAADVYFAKDRTKYSATSDDNNVYVSNNMNDTISKKDLAVLEKILLPNQKKWALNHFKVAKLDVLTNSQYGELMQMMKDKGYV